MQLHWIYNTSYELDARRLYLLIIAPTCFGLSFCPSSRSSRVFRCLQFMCQLSLWQFTIYMFGIIIKILKTSYGQYKIILSWYWRNLLCPDMCLTFLQMKQSRNPISDTSYSGYAWSTAYLSTAGTRGVWNRIPVIFNFEERLNTDVRTQ